ncbi:MAG: universal stress protein [Candidatus Bathyarchaeia archaeon]
MVSYKNILYCSDFSEDADTAFIHALDLAQRHMGKLYVLHVIHSPYHLRRDMVDEYVSEKVSVKANQELLEKAQNDLKERYASRIGDDLDYELVAMEGIPFVEIIRFARKKEIDVIVMGAVGKSDINRQSFGSTVENVARRAHCHVVAIRNPEAKFQIPG